MPDSAQLPFSGENRSAEWSFALSRM